MKHIATLLPYYVLTAFVFLMVRFDWMPRVIFAAVLVAAAAAFVYCLVCTVTETYYAIRHKIRARRIMRRLEEYERKAA